MPDWKNYNDQTTAVRETGDCRHHGGSIEGPLIPLEYHRTMVLRVPMGALNWDPIMQRDASLSDS